MAFVGEMMERAEALEIERQRREVERQERADVRLDRLLGGHGAVGRKTSLRNDLP